MIVMFVVQREIAFILEMHFLLHVQTQSLPVSNWNDKFSLLLDCYTLFCWHYSQACKKQMLLE